MAILKWKFSSSSSQAATPVHPATAQSNDEHVNGGVPAAPINRPNIERPPVRADSNHSAGVSNHIHTAPKASRKHSPERDAGIGVSNKMFGMENFGNTCYCNSILQCLFHSSELREAVLDFPPTQPRPRKKSVSGLRPHPAIAVAAAAAAAPAPNSNGVENDNAPTKTDNPHGTDHNGANSLETEHAKKNRLSFLGGRHSNNGSAVATNNVVNGTNPIDNSSAASPVSQVSAAAVVSNPPNGQNVTPENDPNSYEQKKRAALLKGPIINMDLSYAKEYEMDESLFTSLKDIFESINESSSPTGVVSPSKLIEVLKRDNELFRSSMHQDAHEFLNFLLNEVIDRVKTHAQKLGSEPGTEIPASIARLGDLFEGDLSSETKCLTCERVSTRDEKFLDLSIDLENDTSVTACLRQFSAIEMLCERNKFYCDVCNGLQEAEKRMKIKRLPRILALHLKRFKFTEDMQRNVKLFHKVVYPFHLRLFDTTDDSNDPNRLYELYAVVVHIGGGPYHGHYVAIVKNSDNNWILYDDELVEQVDENFVKNFFGDRPGMASAYVLFYRCITDKDLDDERRYVNPDFSEQEMKSSSDDAKETITIPIPVEHPISNGDSSKHHIPSTVPEVEITQDLSSSSDEVMTASSVLEETTNGSVNASVSEDFFTFTTPNQMQTSQSSESNISTPQKVKTQPDQESSRGKTPSSDGLNSADESGSHTFHSAEESQDHLAVPGGSSPSDHNIPDIQHHHSKKISLGHGLSRLRSTSRSKKEKEGSRFWKKDKDKKDSTDPKDGSDSYGNNHQHHHGGLKNGFSFSKNKKSSNNTIHEGESVF